MQEDMMTQRTFGKNNKERAVLSAVTVERQAERWDPLETPPPFSKKQSWAVGRGLVAWGVGA